MALFMEKHMQEAKQKKQLCLSELDKEKKGPKTECLFEAATQAWLQQIEEKVRESTYSKYRRLCASYICPFLGKITLDALTEEKMDKFTEYLLKSGGASENTLSPNGAGYFNRNEANLKVSENRRQY